METESFPVLDEDSKYGKRPSLPQSRFHISSAFLTVMTLICTSLAQETDTTLLHVRAVEERIEVEVDSFDQMAYFHSTTERYHLGRSLRIYPYIVYSLTDSSASLCCYVHTAFPSWLFLHGMAVMIGDKRYSYAPSAQILDSTYRHEVGSFDGEAACVEWLYIRARKRDSTMALFKAIASAPDSVTIRIRAKGEQDHADWVLTDLERSAWQDVMYYYERFSMRDRDISKFVK